MRLVDVVPELRSLLPPEEREQLAEAMAERALTLTEDAPVAPLGGAWLVAEGALLRTSAMERVPMATLAGPGDVVELRWVADLLPRTVSWRAVCPVTALVPIDEDFLTALCPHPSVAALLVARGGSAHAAAADAAAIARLTRVHDRILATFLHLADRFGRPTDAGIAVDIEVDRRVLAELVSAPRAIVGGALRGLSDSETVRRTDTGWLVDPHAASALGAAHTSRG